ncbi:MULTISPECIES: TetR/AcrR family transcriptional regulator C-terminal domain-containing protein [unclassified Plantibacter]|uniref:TetR/AcrR family transcriptional regulator C-terminal domain-containing protein n=1 Tax=unclassified Plantibacter TaxID=2624265 RepID=UPI003D3539D6
MATASNPRYGHTRHSRDDVAQAALAILDEHGLADLTMRRLAATLDVQPSALYWHFENKQSLLATLSDRIVAPRATTQEDVDWSVALAAEALVLRESLLAYRDGAEVVASTIALGLGAEAPMERFTSVIGKGGYDQETSAAAAAVLLHFVLGHVSHEQQRLQADSLGVVAPDHSLDPSATGSDATEAFRFGIALLIDGLRVRGRSEAEQPVLGG